MNKGMLIALCLASNSVLADSESNSYRCGNDLITLGDNIFEVQDICGQSDGVYRWTEARASGSYSAQGGDYQARSDELERHKYSDYGKLDTYLIFRNGTLERIVQGRR